MVCDISHLQLHDECFAKVQYNVKLHAGLPVARPCQGGQQLRTTSIATIQ